MESGSECTPSSGEEEEEVCSEEGSREFVPEDELLATIKNSEFFRPRLTPAKKKRTRSCENNSQVDQSHWPTMDCDDNARNTSIQVIPTESLEAVSLLPDDTAYIDILNADFVLLDQVGENLEINCNVKEAFASNTSSPDIVYVQSGLEDATDTNRFPQLFPSSSNVIVQPTNPEELSDNFPPQDFSSTNIVVEDNPDVSSFDATDTNLFPQLFPSSSYAIVQPTNPEELSDNFPPQDCSSTNIVVEDNPEVSSKKKKEDKRESTKLNRMRGKSYTGYRRSPLQGSSTSISSFKQKKKKFKVVQDVMRGERKMGPPCSSKRCEKFKNKRKCSKITEEKRTDIFKEFWTWSWQTKRTFVRTVTEIAKPRRLTKPKKGHSHRKISYYYYLNVDGEKYPVCKTMFLSTLGCTAEEVRYWLSRSREKTGVSPSPEEATVEGDEKELEPDECNERDNINESADNLDESHLQSVPQKKNGHTYGQSRIARRFRKQYLDDWLDKLPKLPSHYARKDSKKLYLQSDFRSVTQVYEAYANQCLIDEVGCMGATNFADTLDKKNIGIFTPRKDKCDTCCAFEMNNLPEDVYKDHIKRKEDAHKEKNNDKERAKNGEIHAIVCDMMKVQCLPLISASAAYYKLKLSVHNFTVFNLGNKDVMSYWFDETNSDLSASTFASFLVNYITELFQKCIKPVVIFSDGCGYQHRNAVLANALLHLSMNFQTTITHKYLEVGHTYSEGDSVHARIEASYENLDVHLPSQFVEHSIKARKNPLHYRAIQISHEFVKDFSKSMIYPSIRPGKSPGDPVVTDLRVIQYNSNGRITYKLNYSDELAELPQRPRKVEAVASFPALFKKTLQITLDKYRDLQSLKPMLPNDVHAFYDNLPHDLASQREAKRKNNQKDESKKEVVSKKKKR